eukprot:1142714-Pelagomonas_calceolata.AAC.1
MLSAAHRSLGAMTSSRARPSAGAVTYRRKNTGKLQDAAAARDARACAMHPLASTGVPARAMAVRNVCNSTVLLAPTCACAALYSTLYATNSATQPAATWPAAGADAALQLPLLLPMPPLPCCCCSCCRGSGYNDASCVWHWLNSARSPYSSEARACAS